MARSFLLLLTLPTLCACNFQPRDMGQPQQVAKDRAGNTYTFGDIDQVQGTRFFTIPILRTNEDRAEGTFSSSYRGDDERNRLIIDSATGASRRVLPNQNLQIVNWFEPTTKPENGKIIPDDQTEAAQGGIAMGLYAAVVKRLSKSDKDPASYDVLLGRFQNGQQAWIATGLSGVESLWITPDHKLAMVAATNTGGVYRVYDVSTFKQQLETKLPL